MERSLTAGDPLHDEPRLGADENAHAASPAFARSAAVPRGLEHRRRRRRSAGGRPRSGSRGPGGRSFRPAERRSARWPRSRSSASRMPCATRSQRVMPPKMLISTAFTAGSDRIDLERGRHRVGAGAAADVQEVRGLRARLRHHVERRHHQAGAVADDPDRRRRASRIAGRRPSRATPPGSIGNAALQRLEVRVPPQRVVVDRDLGVQRHDACRPPAARAGSPRRAWRPARRGSRRACEGCRRRPRAPRAGSVPVSSRTWYMRRPSIGSMCTRRIASGRVRASSSMSTPPSAVIIAR